MSDERRETWDRAVQHAPSHLESCASTLRAAHQHVGHAHQRLAFAAADPNPDVLAACLEDLYQAMKLLEQAEPALRQKQPVE
jgi:hypothetical protein